MSQRNERLITEVTQFLDSVQSAMTQASDARRQRDALTASASVERGRITVVVNASGSIVQTRFSEDVDDLTYSQIARATVEAAQQAAAEVKRKSDALLAPLQATRAALPQLPDLIDGVPRLRDEITTPPTAPLTPHDERTAPVADVEFEDAVEYRPSRRSMFDR